MFEDYFAMRKLFVLLLILPFLVFPAHAGGQTEPHPVTVYFFWGEGCPHCAKEEAFLETLSDRYSHITVRDFEIYNEKDNLRLLQDLGKRLDADISGVPFTLIGEEYFVGYNNDQTSGKHIEDLIQKYSYTEYSDPFLSISSEPEENGNEASVIQTGNFENFSLPFFGDMNLSSLSLPVLTAAFGIADGFNPCAMWALLFLITLLLGMENKRRRWVLGSIFIAVSGISYFLFMAAWLNLFLFIGFIVWVRVLIALIALAGGAHSIRDFFKNRGAVCETTNESQKKKITASLERFVHEKNFWIAAGGITVLAFAVNLIELVCSAGLPAVYTQILALNELSTIHYYLYLLLYIFFFMLDDLVIFFVAMVTLEVTGASGKYVRWARLIGGVLMAVIGILLLVKPEWLMFG